MSLARDPALGDPAATLQFFDDRKQALMFEVQGKDLPDAGGFGLVNRQKRATRIDVIAEEGVSSGPFALAARGGDLVAGPLGDDLALELGEGQQDVEHEASHRRGG